MTQNKYDIFISYRRETGEDKARILNQFLSTIGYRTFFDHESGMTGEFETEILAAVEIAPVFLMLLTPGCLDNCINEDDWVRRELKRATDFGKEIIPIRPNYNFNFDNLPKGIPDFVMRLSKLEFAELDYHKNFKSTANAMVEEQIKKFVQPSIQLTGSGNKGAIIHFFSDISCRIFHFGRQVAVTDATNNSIGSVVRLLRGDHKLDYQSIEHELDAYSEIYNVPDNDYESFVNIELQPIKDKRKKKEAELKAEEDRKAAEERDRISRSQTTADTSKYDYDLFFCYSRQDASIVRQAYQFLTNAGYKCWMDYDWIASGDVVQSVFDNAILKSKCVLFFSSKNSNMSDWVIKELNYANLTDVFVIPVRLDHHPLDNRIRLDTKGFLFPHDIINLQRREDLENLLGSVRYILNLIDNK